jgi:hypothetical protein
MANLRGFPASNTISPSVRITENDLTFISPTTSFHRIGLVGFASKGPINTPTSVTSLTNLVSKFGNPHPDTGDPYLIYAAQQVLRISSELIVTRVADTDPTSAYQATTAGAIAPATGGLIDIIGANTGPFVFAVNSYFSWKLNGVLASKILTVEADTYATTDSLVTVLNDQLVPEIDGIEFYTTTSDTLGLKSIWAYGSSSTIELVSHQDSIYGGASSIVGMGTSMTQAELLGTENKYPDDIYTSVGDWNFSGISATILSTALQVVISGTGNVNIDDVVQVIDLSALAGGTYTTAQVVTEINSQIASLPAGGFEADDDGADHIILKTLAYGSGSKLVVKTDSTVDVIFGLSNATQSGLSPLQVTGDGMTDEAGVVRGASAASGAYSFTIYADSPGIEGNETVVQITNNPNDGTFAFKVFNNGAQVEAWGNLTKNQTSSFYVATYINSQSSFIRVTDNTALSAPPANTGAAGIQLSGGTDGIPVDPDVQDDIIKGNATAGTGLYAFSEPEQVVIDLLAAPGRSSASVVQTLIDVCEMRQDCLAIIDPPFGLTVNEIIQWQNGVHPLNNVQLNTDFAALYYPWVEQTDVFNNIPVWVPPSGSVMAAYCQSDTFGGPWLAPAGLKRGFVPNINNVFTRPSLEEKDLMYGNSNAINPIITYPDIAGFVIWGQKTLQRTPTALDRVNVRRMLFYIEKSIKDIGRSYLFELNTAGTRTSFTSACASVLGRLQQNDGITNFVIKCDEELNTTDVISRNEIRARIGIVPTYAIEFIFIEFNLVRELA